MQESNKKAPLQHVAIIMDGNGRWAQAHGKERVFGHINGVESIRHAVKAAITNGVAYLSLYAFSTENWNRPQEEVDALMELLCKSTISEVPVFIENGVRVKFIGDRSRLSDNVKQSIDDCVNNTAQGQKLELIVAINYSSRDEITRATRKIAEQVAAGQLSPEEINQQTIISNLDTAGVPDPDLLIRTSGEMRLSNFMLWQLAYTELYVTDILWPDFNAESFDHAINEFNNRDRRFGAIKK
ncbi:MAG: isoprenyl transferase [Rikenellaceae bacterium]